MNSDDKSGIQESFDTALEGEVGGVGRTLVGVCNRELKIKININNLFTRNQCAVLEVSKHDKAADILRNSDMSIPI